MTNPKILYMGGVRTESSPAFPPKPRPNTPAAVYRLEAAKALLAKALLFVKQAREDYEEVRVRVDAEQLSKLEEDLRFTMKWLSDLAAEPNGLALKTETPEEGP